MDDKMLDRAAQRAQQYWLTDGIAELVMGGFFVLLGVYFGGQAILPEDSFLASMWTPAMLLVIVGGSIGARAFIRTLKERLTYPRTGYVAYHRPDKKRRWITLLFAMGMAMLVSALFASAPAALAWIPGVSGLMFGAFWLFYAHRRGVARFYALAALSAVAGSAISFSGLDEVRGLPLFYVVMGLAFLVSGSFALRSYLRRTPLQPDGPDESAR